jgi:hypothetical protein
MKAALPYPLKPRTLLEGLSRIHEAAELGALAPRAYVAKDGSNCSIGILLSPPQLEHIVSLKDKFGRSFNEMKIGDVSKKVGAKNLEYMTGMSKRQLIAIQDLNDSKDRKRDANRLVARELGEILETGKGMIRGVRFKL